MIMKNTTSYQFALLLEEMRRCPELAKGPPTYGCNRQQWKEKWDKIQGKLNSRGPPIRSTLKRERLIKEKFSSLIHRRQMDDDII